MVCRLPNSQCRLPVQRPSKARGAFGSFVLALLLTWVLPPGAQAADSDVVINEIMYHPPLDLEELQYVELFNRGSSEVDLSGWAFAKGIQFAFTNHTKLAAGAWLVVCRNQAALAKQYGQDIRVAGDFSGKLSHGGEQLALVNARKEVVDAVAFSDREPWPTGPDGGSASLERICPFVSGAGAENWAGSSLPTLEGPAGTPGRQNDSYLSHLPPVIKRVQWNTPPPGQQASVTAEVASGEGEPAVTLLWAVLRNGVETKEGEVAMRKLAGSDSGQTYQASIAAQPTDTLVRFRVQAVDAAGAVRLQPSPHEPRPTYSYYTCVNTNSARVSSAYVLRYAHQANEIRGWMSGGRRPPAEPTRGDAAFIYVPPEGGEVLTFDHVATRARTDGFKVHFQKDRPFRGMTGINLLAGQHSPRWLLSEPLAFELYRQAGVPAPLTDHLRVWVNGRCLGYQLLIEQPNKSFLARNHRDESGNLYKLVWQNQGLVAQHEKKTHLTEGSQDLVEVIKGLTEKAGAAQWAFIQEHFNVDEVASYYAVNMCIQNWDGFFNNYFAYHDTGGTGRWEIYPWDEDKTWGDFDGTSSAYDWHTMPLTLGMAGDQPPRGNPLVMALGGGGPHGGPNWWRRPGWFSGPLLANAEFRQRFLTRLGELCQTNFTAAAFGPAIDALEKRLEGEIPVAAQVAGRDPAQASRAFHRDMESFRKQLQHRRSFIQGDLARGGKPPSFPWLWLVAGLVLIGSAVLAGVWGLSRSLRRAAARRPPPLPGPPRMVPPILTPTPPLPVRPPPLPPPALPPMDPPSSRPGNEG